MKLLLFGGSGQLGYEIISRCKDLNFKIISPVTSEVDVTLAEQVDFLVEKFTPDVVINCAAYTAVDLAETEPQRAFEINELGVKNIATAVARNNSYLVSISTDYVFDGKKGSAYQETDDTNPLNVYGKSKLAGEKVALEILGDKALIIRTSSLHGQRGNNFVHTMLRLFQEKNSLDIVNDQFMTVTWAGWLAEMVLDLTRIRASGIIHAAGEGALTWYDFAEAILELSKEHNPRIKKDFKLNPVSAANFNRPAKRPEFSALDSTKLADILGYPPITWRDGLLSHLKQINFQQ